MALEPGILAGFLVIFLAILLGPFLISVNTKIHFGQSPRGK